MSYTYPISSVAMFEDRFDQFVTLGLPRSDVQNMRCGINDMWVRRSRRVDSRMVSPRIRLLRQRPGLSRIARFLRAGTDPELQWV
jgi:hypothetical protein